jgi:putative ABC transport system permease protein
VSDASRLRLRDLFGESTAGLLQRPARSMLTTLGTLLGVGAFVTVLGLTATAGGQIDRRFTELAATEVQLEDAGSRDGSDTTMSFPPDAAQRVEALNGVVHAGVYWPVSLRDATFAAAPGVYIEDGGLSLVAIEPSALSAMHPSVREGRLYDTFHSGRAEAVAVLGSAAAARLGVIRLDGNPAVFVSGVPFTVVGIIDDLQRMPELLFSVIIPTTTALSLFEEPTDQRAKMLIETRLGAAKLIASQAALAVRPDAPERIKAVVASDPQVLRGRVTGDLGVLFLMLAVISLVIGAVGIANTTLVAVLERTAEIGLRRSLGARPRHIAAQFLAESTALGAFGGLVGAALGVGAVLCVAVAQQWTAVLAPWTVVAAPGIGTVVGLVAGLYPALRASRVEPVNALRR